MKSFLLATLFVFGCSLSGCVGELKAAGADQANPIQSAGGPLPLVTITIQCDQSPDSSTYVVAVATGKDQAKPQKDGARSQDSAGQ